MEQVINYRICEKNGVAYYRRYVSYRTCVFTDKTITVHIALFLKTLTRNHTIKDRFFYLEDYVIDIARRWKQWARKRVETRAANTIRNFYYDYVVPRVYNPHTRGEGFLRLEAKMREINKELP